jgi:hypothetical protein
VVLQRFELDVVQARLGVAKMVANCEARARLALQRCCDPRDVFRQWCRRWHVLIVFSVLLARILSRTSPFA